MKKIFIATLAFLALSTYSVHAQTQEINQTTKTQKGIILYGKQNLEPFDKKPFKAWFDEEYTPYVVDQPSVKKLEKENLSAYEIVIYLGSWCPDSHREFPRFIKILRELKYPEKQLQIYALDREKKGPHEEEKLYNVTHVPTFIVKKDGKEIGRITEAPESGFLEKDLLNIISKTK
ncbi:thioredoxin family protein [Elizabethkingia meningoseptica]|uniref:TlpA family protein disulfide reductase n=1 Tax=Elizabethkingia meningoseptica TaxID=238 RepID=UPI003017AB50